LRRDFQQAFYGGDEKDIVMEKKFRGVFAIPQIIFYEDLSVDYEATARCVQFLLDCGVHGVVVPVYASEYFSLSMEERKKILEQTLRRIDGKIPVVAGISAPTTSLAVEYARHASDCGADAVISANPAALSFREAVDYFRMIDEIISIPIFVQNLGPAFGGKSMPSDVVIEIIKTLHNVCYLKEEGIDSNKAILAAVSAAQTMPHKFMGIMGGQGCRVLIEEYRRGICGTMPPSQTADVLVDIWNLLETGKLRDAFDLHTRLLPVLAFAGTHKLPAYKEILKLRGVIKCTACRPYGWPQMDAKSYEDLKLIMESVDPFFRIRY
jgi:4-hydroxy-tetrahydrodipicolinate synthase